MNYKPFAGAEEFVGDYQRPDRVIACATASIADHMGVAFGQAGVFSRIKAGIHAGENGEVAARGEGQGGLFFGNIFVFWVWRPHLLPDLWYFFLLVRAF